MVASDELALLFLHMNVTISTRQILSVEFCNRLTNHTFSAPWRLFIYIGNKCVNNELLDAAMSIDQSEPFELAVFYGNLQLSLGETSCLHTKLRP